MLFFAYTYTEKETWRRWRSQITNRNWN